MAKMEAMSLGFAPAVAEKKPQPADNPVEIVAYNMLLRAFDKGLDILPWLKTAGMTQARFKELLLKHNGSPADMSSITTTKDAGVSYQSGWDDGYRNGMVDTIRALHTVSMYNDALGKESADVPASQIACEAGMYYGLYRRLHEIYEGKPAIAPAVHDLMKVIEAINSEYAD